MKELKDCFKNFIFPEDAQWLSFIAFFDLGSCRAGNTMKTARLRMTDNPMRIPKSAFYSLFIESFFQMCFEGKWLQNRLRAEQNESRSLSAVDIQGHQHGGFCIVPDSELTESKRTHGGQNLRYQGIFRRA